MQAGVDVRVLGDVGVRVDGAEVGLPPGKQVALLAMLALQVGRSVPADRLVVGLWGADAPAEAVKTLQVHVSTLRKRLRVCGLDVTFSPSGYRLGVDDDQVDLGRFEALADRGLQASADGRPEVARELLGQALRQWSGEALSNVLDAPFAHGEVEALELRRTAVAIAKVDADLALGLGSTVVREVRELAAASPYDERICWQLMVALYRAGDQAQSLAELRRFRARLRNDLGLAPGPELVALERRILVHDAELLVPVGVRQVRRDNLPVDVATFVGRRRELDDVRDAVERSRLTTVTGAGGAGKTRLVVRAAQSFLDDPGQGVWLVELAGLADPALVPGAIAGAIGIQAGDIDELVGALGERRALIVLDNCEHIVDAVADVVLTLLRRCANLRMLTTSREPLAIEGERVYRIPPLNLPSGNAPGDLADSDAVQLFVERAGLQVPGFALDPTTAPHVVRICERLDGLPLAIELAAARLSSLPLETISRMLGERLSLLSGSRRHAEDRQRTIHALVDWSYALLSEDAQAMLQALSVFAGGFTLEAVASVTGADTVDLVSELVDKSLVEVADPRTGRLRLLETIREFAAERLAERGPQHVRAVRDAHADYFQQLAATSAPVLERGGRDQAASLDRLALEHDNLRATGATLLDHGRLTDGLKLVTHLRMFWEMRGHFREGATATQTFLDAVDPTLSPHDYGMALCTAADMHESLGDLIRTSEHATRAEILAAATGDVDVAVYATSSVAAVDVQRGEPRRALERLQRLRAEDLRGVDAALLQRLLLAEAGAALACGELALAKDSYTEVIAGAVAVGSDRRHALALSNLSVVDMEQGDLVAASAHLERALELNALMGDLTSTSYIRVNLGLVALLSEETTTAHTRYREALLIVGANGDSTVTHCALLGVALCAGYGDGDAVTAVTLHGVIDRFLRTHPSALMETEMSLREDDLSARRERMNQAEFDRLLGRGCTISVADAVDLALAVRPTGAGRTKFPSTP